MTGVKSQMSHRRTSMSTFIDWRDELSLLYVKLETSSDSRLMFMTSQCPFRRMTGNDLGGRQ